MTVNRISNAIRRMHSRDIDLTRASRVRPRDRGNRVQEYISYRRDFLLITEILKRFSECDLMAGLGGPKVTSGLKAEGRRPASVEGVLTPISSRSISDRLDLYKGAFQSLSTLYLVHHPDIQIFHS